MIIDATYFVGEINIAQLGQPEVLELVNRFIGKYEKRFMQEYFGATLAKKIIDENTTPGDPLMEAILTGADFEYKGEPVEWIGLKNTEKISPIANYVFYFFVENGLSSQAGVGEVWNKAENAQLVSPDSRLAYIWNDMIEMLKPLELLLKDGNYSERTGKNFSIINSLNL